MAWKIARRSPSPGRNFRQEIFIEVLRPRKDSVSEHVLLMGYKVWTYRDHVPSCSLSVDSQEMLQTAQGRQLLSSACSRHELNHRSVIRLQTHKQAMPSFSFNQFRAHSIPMWVLSEWNSSWLPVMLSSTAVYGSNSRRRWELWVAEMGPDSVRVQAQN